MGRHNIVQRRKPFCTYRRALAFVGASLAFLVLGFAVREAEDNQIGSTSTASLWTFFLAGLCLYVAAVAAWAAWRRTRTKTKEAARAPLPST